MTPDTPLAVVEVLGADGQVRQSVPVLAWPLTVGRAADNHIALADPHVAPHHLRLVVAGADLGAAGVGARAVFVEVGETRNGVGLGERHLAAGQVERIDASGPPAMLLLGRTRLRLRLPGHALDPELPLGPAPDRTRGHLRLAAGLVTLVAALLFQRWLEADPDLFARSAGAMLLTVATSAAVWCGAWALLSRIFTRQARFGWHLQVFVYASIAYLAADAIATVLSFALDWPWLADFVFAGNLAIAGAALTFHLYAVEPGRPRLVKAIGAVAAVGGIALTLWMNVQRSDRIGSDLYLSHILPPQLRLAGTEPVDRFVDGLSSLQPVLDRKAREADSGGDADPEE